MHSQVHVRQSDGRPFAIVQVDEPNGPGPEDNTYFLCVSTLDEGADEWRELGRLVEGSRSRPDTPAHAGTNWGTTLRFSFATSSDGDRLVVAYVDRIQPLDQVFVQEIAIDEEGDLGAVLSDEIVRPTSMEFQLLPALTVGPGGTGLSFYEMVTAPDETRPEADTVRVIAATPAAGAAWSTFPLSDEAFDPCPTTTRSYFGDYIGIAPVGTRFVTAWADSRDGCDHQNSSADTFHQHTYADVWQ